MLNKQIPTHAIYIDSSVISGAEKRAIKLFHQLNNMGLQCYLITSKRLFDLFNVSEYQEYLNNAYIIVADRGWLGKVRKNRMFFYLRKFTGFNRLIQRIYFWKVKQILKDFTETTETNLVLHLFLDFKLAININNNSELAQVIFEVTSPDCVKKISSSDSKKINNVNYFHAVSKSTYIKTIQLVPKLKVGKAPIPLFIPDYNINHEEIFEAKENNIVFAHRLIPRKNGLLFAKVVKEFLKNYPSWNIKFFGKGEQATEINTLLYEEILAGKVTTGYQTKILEELVKSKIFVSLIEPDNYPSQSVLEAMYTGNALLLSDCGSTKENFYDKNGLLCQVDFDDILDKLTKLASDQDTLKSLGKNSINLVQHRFDKNRYINHIRNIYKLVGNY